MAVQSPAELVQKKCKPCEGGVDPYSPDEAKEQLKQLNGWRLTHDGQRIRKDWKVKNFMAGMKFFNQLCRAGRRRRPPSRSAHRRLSQRVGRTVDARDRRPVGKRFHPGGEDRRTADRSEDPRPGSIAMPRWLQSFPCLHGPQGRRVEMSRPALSRSHVERSAAGDVLIRVAYSSLNYKDALAAQGHPGVVRTFPHVPGIDCAGTVVESTSPDYRPGDEVLVTGYELGAGHWGGYRRIRARAGRVGRAAAQRAYRCATR